MHDSCWYEDDHTYRWQKRLILFIAIKNDFRKWIIIDPMQTIRLELYFTYMLSLFKK